MQEPEYHQHEDYKIRLGKLEEIRALGIEPYPQIYKPTHKAYELISYFADKNPGHSDDAASGSSPEVCVAGRLMLFRSMGKNAFAHIQDDSGRIQLMFNREQSKVNGLNSDVPSEHMKFVEKKIDLGDFVGIKGNLFRTQKGELTIFVKECTLLCKTLLPLPDKYSGLEDKELRYKKRWLDLIVNKEAADILKARSKIIRSIRKFFEERGFLEVETGILQNIYGGAEAKPFETTLNAYHQKMFLRISLEIPLKKLVVGGIEKVFELSKSFRNEGIDKTHNPEFTQLEAYAAYTDYNDMMVIFETLFETLALELFGTTKITAGFDKDNKQTIDLKAPWKRISMKESVKVYGGVDVDTLSLDELRAIVKEKTDLEHKDIMQRSKNMLMVALFEALVEDKLIQPHHIIDHPIETTPLCKLHRNLKLKEDGFVERFESFILGKEFCNAYTELNDPVMQRELLEDQAKKRLEGDEEAHPMDEEFIEAVCQGMPPTGGIGMGIDRMCMVLTNAESIRDVIYFPIMRSED